VILLGLRLQNFRQHADSEIVFGPGLTGIIGPNGAGKSTILEAIAWAIYGSEAARGTNETIRFARAGGRARVEVELRFRVGGHEYRVVRTLSGAEVFMEGVGSPVATTLGGVTRYLQGLLGMTRREFFNTYFTGQKELQFLAAMGPSERGKFLSQVLGYEKLRKAQDLLRAHRNELRHEIAGLRTAMGDPAAIEEEKSAAEARVREAVGDLAASQAARAEAAAALADVAPRWADVQTSRERHRELTHAVETADHDRESVTRDVERIGGEIETSRTADRELGGLREQLAELPAVREQSERLAELARLEERRRALAEQLAELQDQVQRAAERLTRVEQAPTLVERYGADLARLRAEQQAVRDELDAAKTAWLRDRQDAETKLLGFRERGQELKEQIRGIRELGPAGICPTCGRPVGNDFERLLGELEEQWTSIVQDGKWWKSRREQLDPKPEPVTTLEAGLAELSAVVDETARKHARCESAVNELRALQDEQTKREARERALRAELDALPTGYDAALHRDAERRLRALQAVEKQAARLEESAGRRPALEEQMEKARARQAEVAERRRLAEEERRALGFSEDRFARLHEEHERASELQRRAELRVVELQGQVRSAEQALQTAERAEQRFRDQAREVEAREDEFRHHNELDAALSELRGELNNRVRPELSEIARCSSPSSPTAATPRSTSTRATTSWCSTRARKSRSSPAARRTSPTSCSAFRSRR